MITVNTKEVKITEAPKPLTGEVNVETLDFEFSPEWAEVIKVAVFVVAGKPIYQVIRDSQCSIPALNYSGTVGLGVFGYIEENGETVLRYSPKPTTLKVGKGSYIAGGDSAEISQTDFERYVAQIEEMISELRGVESVDIVEGHLIVTYTDGSTHDAGEIEGGGTGDYDDLINQPKVNNNTLTGNKTSAQLGLQDKLISGTNIKTINGGSLLGSGNLDLQIEVIKPLPAVAYTYTTPQQILENADITDGWHYVAQDIELTLTSDEYTIYEGSVICILRFGNDGEIFVYSTVIDDIVVQGNESYATLYVTDLWVNSNFYNKNEITTMLLGKQNTLTFDNAPTANSTNPVTSGGIYTAQASKQDVNVQLTTGQSQTQTQTITQWLQGFYDEVAGATAIVSDIEGVIGE